MENIKKWGNVSLEQLFIKYMQYKIKYLIRHIKRYKWKHNYVIITAIYEIDTVQKEVPDVVSSSERLSSKSKKNSIQYIKNKTGVINDPLGQTHSHAMQ